jgi:hypothetical protein
MNTAQQKKFATEREGQLHFFPNFDNKFLHFEPILAIIIGYILSSK